MKKEIRITFCINDREKEMLEACLKQSGKCISEFIRGLLNREYDKLFPPYLTSPTLAAKRVPKEELTNEQICEMKGGKVGMREGIEVCIKKVGESSTKSVPLSRISEGTFKYF
jgi:hypothetical protein